MSFEGMLSSSLALNPRNGKFSKCGRYMQLVTQDWMKALYSKQALPEQPALSQAEVDLYLAPSTRDLPANLERICIEIISKNNCLVESHVEQPLSKSEDLGYSELLNHIHQEGFRRLWKEACARYRQGFIPDGKTRDQCIIKNYNQLVRDVLEKFYGCPVATSENYSSKKHVPAACAEKCDNHSNIIKPHSILESQSAYIVILSFPTITLQDSVTFSPAVLQGSFAKPLFIVYQLLQVISYCHSKGLPLGDLRLQDILLDSKLWLRISRTSLKNCYQQQPSEKSDADSDTDTQVSSLLNDDTPKTSPRHLTSNTWTKELRDYHKSDLPHLMTEWIDGNISNFDYLIILNYLAGRRAGDPNNHPVLPWVMDFTQAKGGYRDLSKSKYRLNKGDHQLDMTYDVQYGLIEGSQIPHHISDVLSDITYYVYKARQTPRHILCKHVRSNWVPNEYPSSMERMQTWTPDECIPEFFTDPTIFSSIHSDLPDLEIPVWAESPEDFIHRHMSVLEGNYVSQRIHQWIDLTFGYKLSGNAAVKSKNVCLQLVDKHTDLTNHGVVQLFNQPHPPRRLKSGVATRVPPNFRRHSFVPEDEKEIETISSKKEVLQGDKKPKSDIEAKSSHKLNESGIQLPRGYDPLASLEQLETLFTFSSRAAHQTLPKSKDSHVVQQALGYRDQMVFRDMQNLGCLLVEMFLSHRLRTSDPDSSLIVRYSIIRKVCMKYMEEIPRPFRNLIKNLLKLHADWSPPEDPDNGPLFEYDAISSGGYPPPNATLLLHPEIDITPFPPYFAKLYLVLSKLKANELEALQLFYVAMPDIERFSKQRKLGKERVQLLARYVSKYSSQLGLEGLQMILPYFQNMLDDPVTGVEAAWALFNPIAFVLGAKESCRQFLPKVTRLYDGEMSTSKHIKLYHRSFILQLLIQLGLETFLINFSTLLVEACAGYKNFGDDSFESQMIQDDYSGGNEMDFPDIFIEETSDGEHKLIVDSPNSNTRISVAEEAIPDDEANADESMGLFMHPDEFKPARSDLDSLPDPMSDDRSVGSLEPSEELLGQSAGRLSVHSISRLMTQSDRSSLGGLSDASNGLSGDSQERVPSESGSYSEKNGLENVDQVDITDNASNVNSTVLSNPLVTDYNIDAVAAETIKWLSQRLGPVLTAKYLSRNLLRMLSLCYLGEEQMETVCRDGSDSYLSTTNKHLSGDLNAHHVLDCLACIAVLYGENVILLQYFTNASDLVTVAQKRLTQRAEAGLISSIVLLIHIIPYLSDSTLMDILQETIFKEIILPLLRLVGTTTVSFPSGSRARRALCYKVIDALYMISLRIGFEQTRAHMTFVLQKFFSAFSLVYGDPGSSGDKTPDQETASKGAVTYEVKINSKTKEYVVTQGQNKGYHQRQGSGSFRYSLAPNDLEEETDNADTNNKDSINKELEETFTPEMAHIAYIPFCKLAGGIHMEQNLVNDDLIRQLCATHDEFILSQSQDKRNTPCVDESRTGTKHEQGQDANSKEDDINGVTGSFGRSVSMTGNKIMIHNDKKKEEGSRDNDAASTVSASSRKSRTMEIDFEKLKSPEMEISRKRHLKGNWLAYWEHELGRNERESSFYFKQIKLQTFSGHSHSVRCLHVMDNENSFLSGSKDKTVRIWSLRSFGDGTGRVGCQGTYSQHKKSVFAVTFLESRRVAASCDSVVHLWDPFVGAYMRQFELPRGVLVTALSPIPSPQSMLLTATSDTTLRFLDIRTSKYTHEFRCSNSPSGMIRCLCVSPDANWVAVGYSTGVITLLDVRTGVLFASWKAHEAEIQQIKCNNSKTFVSSSFDQTMSVWNVEDTKLVNHLKGPNEPVHCFNFYKDEILTATTANRIGVHTIVDGQAQFSGCKLRSDVFRGVVTSMAVLPQNKLLLFGADNGNIKLLA